MIKNIEEITYNHIKMTVVICSPVIWVANRDKEQFVKYHNCDNMIVIIMLSKHIISFYLGYSWSNKSIYSLSISEIKYIISIILGQVAPIFTNFLQ